MPVRDSEGKMQAIAPYGYASDDGTMGLLLENKDDLEVLGREGDGWRKRVGSCSAPTQPHTASTGDS